MKNYNPISMLLSLFSLVVVLVLRGAAARFLW